MHRRCRRSLATEMSNAEKENDETKCKTPRIPKSTLSKSTPRKTQRNQKRLRSDNDDEDLHKTPTKKPIRHDIFEIKSSTEDSDASQSSVTTRSFYGGSRGKKNHYLSPLERSRLKDNLEKDNSCDSTHCIKSPMLRERNKGTPSNESSKRKVNMSVKRRKVTTPNTFTSRDSDAKKTVTPKPMPPQISDLNTSQTKRFFKNSSPGKKKISVVNHKMSKAGLQFSVQSKKVNSKSVLKDSPGTNCAKKNVKRSKDNSVPKVLFDKVDESVKKCTGIDVKKNRGSIPYLPIVLTSTDDESMNEIKEEVSTERRNEIVQYEHSEMKRKRFDPDYIDSLFPSSNKSSRNETDDSGRVSALSTQSEHWDAASNDSSCLVNLLPEDSCTTGVKAGVILHSNSSSFGSDFESEEHSLHSTPTNRKMPGTPALKDSRDTKVSTPRDAANSNLFDEKWGRSASVSETPKSLRKLKSLQLRNSSPIPMQAEDFLPTPAKSPRREKNTAQQVKDVSPAPSISSPIINKESPKVFPIFNRVSSRSGSTCGSSCPATPSSSSSRIALSSLGHLSDDSPRRSPRKHSERASEAATKVTGTPRLSPQKSPSMASNMPGSKSSPGLWRRLGGKDDKSGLSQMTLDFGQKYQKVEACSKCGMTYTHGDPTDEATHRNFHSRLNDALRFKGWKKERVVQEFEDGSRIIMVLPDETTCMKKVNAVKKIVDEDLGFVVENRRHPTHIKAFMYISCEKKIVGFCLAEVISKGYRVMTEEEVQNAGSPTKRKRPWCCSTKSTPARCGINRIWVLKSERHRGIASRLLECVRCNFVMGYIVQKNELAFSDPTPDGRQFATRYTGNPNFLVYNHQSTSNPVYTKNN